MLITVVIGILQLAIAVCQQCDVFLEIPGPMVVEPIGTLVELTCRVQVGFRVVWSINIATNTADILAEQSSLPYLESLGITTVVSTAQNRENPLFISGEVALNQTNIECIAQDLVDTLRRCGSNLTTVTFYGLPSVPADLEATVNGVGSFNISWFLSTIEGVVVTFTMTATNLNDSSTRPMEVSGIQGQHYIFTNIEDSTSCDVYSFQVTAVNGAGTGNSSVITKSLPSPPDISPIQDSLEYSLARTASGVTLSVAFNGAASCPDYPVTNHTLILLKGSSRDKEIIDLEETTNGVYMIEDTVLERNTEYIFYVTASNEVITVNSIPEQIVTTDVQGVVFTRVVGDTYTIQCSYLSGSDVRGCVYVLVSRQSGLENVMGFIERDSNGVTVEVANVGCYSEVLAYDNTTESLPVRTSIPTDETCPVAAGTESSTSLSDFVVEVIIVALVSVLFLVVVLVVILSIYTWEKGCSCCKNGVWVNRSHKAKDYRQSWQGKSRNSEHKIASRAKNKPVDSEKDLHGKNLDKKTKLEKKEKELLEKREKDKQNKKEKELYEKKEKDKDDKKERDLLDSYLTKLLFQKERLDKERTNEKELLDKKEQDDKNVADKLERKKKERLDKKSRHKKENSKKKGQKEFLDQLHKSEKLDKKEENKLDKKDLHEKERKEKLQDTIVKTSMLSHVHPGPPTDAPPHLPTVIPHSQTNVPSHPPSNIPSVIPPHSQTNVRTNVPQPPTPHLPSVCLTSAHLPPQEIPAHLPTDCPPSEGTPHIPPPRRPSLQHTPVMEPDETTPFVPRPKSHRIIVSIPSLGIAIPEQPQQRSRSLSITLHQRPSITPQQRSSISPQHKPSNLSTTEQQRSSITPQQPPAIIPQQRSNSSSISPTQRSSSNLRTPQQASATITPQQRQRRPSITLQCPSSLSIALNNLTVLDSSTITSQQRQRSQSISSQRPSIPPSSLTITPQQRPKSPSVSPERSSSLNIAPNSSPITPGLSQSPSISPQRSSSLNIAPNSSTLDSSPITPQQSPSISPQRSSSLNIAPNRPESSGTTSRRFGSLNIAPNRPESSGITPRRFGSLNIAPNRPDSSGTTQPNSRSSSNSKQS